MLRVMPVFGTRPEAIKMMPLVKALRDAPGVECTVCVTAQHREMLDQVLSRFGTVPQYDLNIMEDAQTLESLTSRVVSGVSGVLKKARPDLVLVHGDTTTTFASALAAFYQKIPVGHVEAGLRSFNRYSPFPEETNRRLTAAIAELHFAPTAANRENLRKENIVDNVYVTGNTVIDALRQTVEKDYRFRDAALGALFNGQRRRGRLILLTAHRRENLGAPLESICRAVRRIVLDNGDVEVVFPVHPNRDVRKVVQSAFDGLGRVYLTEPVDVWDMHNLMNACYMVMTDSGGLQEEAPALGKPVIVLRRETERPEICDAGKAVLAGTDEEDICAHAHRLLHDQNAYRAMQRAANPYGDGKAAPRIVQAILYWAGLSAQKPSEFAPR